MEATTQHKRIVMETGVFVRIQRDGEWRTLDIGELNPAELSEFFSTKERHELLNWLVFLMGGLMGQALKTKVKEANQ